MVLGLGTMLSTAKGVLKPPFFKTLAETGSPIFSVFIFEYLQNTVTCSKHCQGKLLSLSGYSTCRNGGHRPGPRLVPGERPEPLGGVRAHGAVCHGGAVHHVRSCPPPHEYP